MCIKDLLNYPTFANPEYSIFKEHVTAFKIAYFNIKYLNPNWKEEIGLDEWAYET